MAKLPPLSNDKVIEQLRWMWENGTIDKRTHFKEELKAAGASMLDVQTIIFDKPKVISHEWNPERRCYKYRISGEDLEGETLEFVVAFDQKRSILTFITAF